MLASTWMDMVVGVDIHFEMVPTPAGPIPTPFPNPFIGMVFDPAGLAVGLALGAALALATGGTPTGPVLINCMPATNVGTEAKGMGHILIPPGVAWVPMPKFPKPSFRGPPEFPGLPVKPEDDAVSIMGSTTVTIMGSSAVRMGEMWMSCGEPLRMPSSVVIAIPKGPLVLTGGPPGVNLLDALLAMIRTKWVAGYMHSLLSRIKSDRLRNILSKAVCFLTGHPVDVATGRLLTDNVDFELPGPLPLKFERSYASSWSHREGPLGPGWSHSLDQAVWFERGKVVYLSDDGREIEFDVFDLPEHTIRPGQDAYDPINQLTLRFVRSDLIEIKTHDGESREFSRLPRGVGGQRDSWWRLQRRRARSGHEIVLSYDQRGNLSWVRDSGGRVVGFEHDAANRLVSVRLPHPQQDAFVEHIRYFYDSDGDLVKVTDALGASWTFAYQRHLMVRETDRNGLSFYFAYDGWGSGAYCVRTWGDGGIYDHVIDYAKGSLTVVTNSLGYKTAYKLNPIGMVVEVVDARGASTKYEYDDRTLKKVKETNPLGGETTLEYDDRSNIVSVTDSTGEITELVYNPKNNLAESVTRPTGSWRFAFDSNGYARQSIDPCDETLDIHWANGLVQSVRKGNGETVEFGYDAHSAVAQIRGGDGTHSQYEHDRLGRVTRAVDASGLVTTFEYDALSRLRRMTQPGGYVIEQRFDAEGRVVEADINGERRRFVYSGFRVVERHNADGTTVLLRYNSEEQLTEIVNENGERWVFELDEGGSPRAETSFDGRTVRYSRGPMSEITRVQLPSGRSAKLAYDQAGRLKSIQYSDGSSRHMEYGPGRFPSAVDSNGSRLEWSRDGLGRALTETHAGHTVSRSFSHGQEASLETSLGLAQRSIWTNGRLAELRLDIRAPQQTFRFDYGLGAAPARMSSPGNVTQSWTEDATGRLATTSIRSPKYLREQRLEWNSPQHLRRVLDTQTGPVNLEQDIRGRLLGTQRVSRAEAWRLDGVGNRAPAASNWSFEAGGRLRSTDKCDLRHDEDGNLIEKRYADGRASLLEWSASGRLNSVRTPDGRVVRFSYDGLGRRTRKEVVLVSDDGETVQEDVTYVWSGTRLIHELSSTKGLTTWHWGPLWESPIARTRDGHTISFVHDQIGTPVEAFDEKGALIWQMQLDASGQATILGDNELCPWRWAGQYADTETGLHYNWFRYYDPEQARYISQDPIGLFGGNALYAYVNDPTTATDFFGLTAWHHPIPKELVHQMADNGMIDGSKLPANFDKTKRPGNVPLADTAGAHSHTQAHAALSDFLNEKYPGLDLPRGTQKAPHWAEYLQRRDTSRKVLNDLDRFYRQWLPDQIAAGKYPLLTGEADNILRSYEHERATVHGCKK